MNHRIVLSTTGTVLYIEAAMMLIPLLIAMGFKEHKQALAFLAAILIAAGVGFLLRRVAPPQRQDIFSKEGFVIVAMAWLALSLVGALPFTISGAIPHYIDALFETVSGFTTTGATLLQDVEALSYSMQFWRCFTHWIGGMGILCSSPSSRPRPPTVPCTSCGRKCPAPPWIRSSPRPGTVSRSCISSI